MAVQLWPHMWLIFFVSVPRPCCTDWTWTQTWTSASTARPTRTACPRGWRSATPPPSSSWRRPEADKAANPRPPPPRPSQQRLPSSRQPPLSHQPPSSLQLRQTFQLRTVKVTEVTGVPGKGRRSVQNDLELLTAGEGGGTVFHADHIVIVLLLLVMNSLACFYWLIAQGQLAL